jgi:hypothetical protein
VVEMADRRIADARAQQGHYLESGWRMYRARVLFTRGDRAEALDEGATGLELARVAADSQLLTPLLAFEIRVLWETGDDAAESLAQELVDVCRGAPLHVAADWLPEVAVALRGLGRVSDLEAVAETVPTPTPWREGGLALGRGDPLAAAAIFTEMGAKPFEAEARLLAAKEGLDADLPAAIEFFREVGASAYLDEAESLIAKSRSA